MIGRGNFSVRMPITITHFYARDSDVVLLMSWSAFFFPMQNVHKYTLRIKIAAEKCLLHSRRFEHLEEKVFHSIAADLFNEEEDDEENDGGKEERDSNTYKTFCLLITEEPKRH